MSDDPDFEILVELGYGDRLVGLVRDEHPADEHQTRLGWRAGVARRVADDITTPDEAVGIIVETPIHVSGIETFLEKRITVAEAIELYGELTVRRWRDVLREEQERADDPGEVLRRLELYGQTSAPLQLRDPDTVTDDEGREQAAQEIIRHSIDALFTLPMLGTLVGPVQRFYREIEEAAAAFPAVVIGLLYEAGRERRDWPA